MKKSLFMMGMAALAFASCTNEEVTRMAENNTIGFDPFVNKATKTVNDIVGTGSEKGLTKFYAMGSYKTDGGDYPSTPNVFDNVEITLQDGAWKPTNTDDKQYWDADLTYQFAAYSNGNEKLDDAKVSFDKGILKITGYEAGESDLVYALSSRDIKGDAGTAVGLTFNHLLSKVKFTFTSNLPTGYTVTVSSLKFTAKNKGDYTADNSTGWNNLSADTEKTFNAADDTKLKSDECYVIPQDNSSLTATFTVTVTDGADFHHSVDCRASLASGALNKAGTNTWVAGYGYNYTASIGAGDVGMEDMEITFSVDAVNTWESADNSQLGNITNDEIGLN